MHPISDDIKVKLAIPWHKDHHIRIIKVFEKLRFSGNGIRELIN